MNKDYYVEVYESREQARKGYGYLQRSKLYKTYRYAEKYARKNYQSIYETNNDVTCLIKIINDDYQIKTISEWHE